MGTDCRELICAQASRGGASDMRGYEGSLGRPFLGVRARARSMRRVYTARCRRLRRIIANCGTRRLLLAARCRSMNSSAASVSLSAAFRRHYATGRCRALNAIRVPARGHSEYRSTRIPLCTSPCGSNSDEDSSSNDLRTLTLHDDEFVYATGEISKAG